LAALALASCGGGSGSTTTAPGLAGSIQSCLREAGYSDFLSSSADSVAVKLTSGPAAYFGIYKSPEIAKQKYEKGKGGVKKSFFQGVFYQAVSGRVVLTTTAPVSHDELAKLEPCAEQ
jgi:hypothetical protein